MESCDKNVLLFFKAGQKKTTITKPPKPQLCIELKKILLMHAIIY